MKENEAAERIRYAVEKFSDPDVYYQVMLASSPEIAKDTIETLPGVKELVELGPEGGKVALNLLEDERFAGNDNIASIALYVVEQVPPPNAKETLARLITSQWFSGINTQLAAETFLRSAGIDAFQEDAIGTAAREAEKIHAESINSQKEQS
jgi:hypothetical protein